MTPPVNLNDRERNALQRLGRRSRGIQSASNEIKEMDKEILRLNAKRARLVAQRAALETALEADILVIKNVSAGGG